MTVHMRFPALKDCELDVPACGDSPEVSLANELLDTAAGCVYAVDVDWRFIYLNRRARYEIANGRFLTGKVLWDEFPALIGTAVERQYRKAMETKRHVRFEFHYGVRAKWYEIQVSPTSGRGLVVWFQNIDSRKNAEEELRRAAGRLELAAFAVADLMFELNLLTGEVIWHEALKPRFNLRDEARCSPNGWLSQVHPEDRARATAELHRCLQTGERLIGEWRLRKADGTYAEVRQTGIIQHDTSGSPLRMIMVIRDVTEQRRAHLANRRRQTQIANIFSQALVGILESGPNGEVRVINQRYRDILGRNENEVIGVNMMEFTHPDDVEWNQALLRKHCRRGEPFQVEKRYIRPDGTIVWCRLSVSFVLASAGEVESSIVVAEEITQQRETTERLKWASEHDALTGLPNRRSFEARLQALTLSAMHSHGTVGLLLLDLDYFKHVNDSLGHGTGDSLLREIGDRFRACLRPVDFVARLGGDEFAILVEGAEAEAGLIDLGRRILQELRLPFEIEGRSITIDASVGGAVYPADAESAQELLKRADVALNSLKDSGRGGTRMFGKAMLEQALLSASQLAHARCAVSEQSVAPHYQPKVELATGQIVGFEALLRWHHRIRGVQSPDTVAEAFRDYELASKMGDLMQRRVFADLQRWLRQDLPTGRIGINAAPAEFLRDDFAERLLSRMREYEIPACLIEIEVTEHVFERGADLVERALKLLSRSGVGIALDDFGTGYSSLSHLRDFPVNVVKIDRSFVEKIDLNIDIRAIVSAIITLAKSLRIAVVAEGIETEQQRLVLCEQGCPLGQGYYFGHAVPADQVPSLLLNS